MVLVVLFRLLDRQLTNQCNEMIRCYSNVLYCWKMFNLRADLLSFTALKDSDQMKIGKLYLSKINIYIGTYYIVYIANSVSFIQLMSFTEFLNHCNKCTHPVSRPSCEYCKCLSLSCSICHISVKGKTVKLIVCYEQ